MATTLKPTTLAVALSLILCSCATQPQSRQPSAVDQTAIIPATQLPREVSMDKSAGCGGGLNVKVQLEDGQEFPVYLDTGSPAILLDASLAPKLGKPLGRQKFGISGLGLTNGTIYATPKLYLGNVPLMTTSSNCVFDFKGSGIKGIIGMNCLMHYCIQFDFQAHKVRFLNPNHLNISKFGKAYPITFEGGHVFIRHGGFIGGDRTNAQMDALIDSGWYRYDGRVDGTGKLLNLAECTWDGRAYTNIVVSRGKGPNIIGLKFLARHLVTFNFPKHVMYLKQTSVGPLTDEGQEAARTFFAACQKDGLPGSPPTGRTNVYREMSDGAEDIFECVIRPEQDPTRWHYLIARASDAAPWKLQRAWQTDATGTTIKEYPIP